MIDSPETQKSAQLVSSPGQTAMRTQSNHQSESHTTFLHFMIPGMPNSTSSFPPVTTIPSEQSLPSFLSTLYGISPSALKFYSITPIEDEGTIRDMAKRGENIGFTCSSEIGMNMEATKLFGYLEENKQLKVQNERLRDSLLTISREYKKYLENPSMINDIETQKMARKNRKLKELEEENKRLKNLVRSHFDTSEQLRLDTLNTVEALKSEFSHLREDLVAAERNSPGKQTTTTVTVTKVKTGMTTSQLGQGSKTPLSNSQIGGGAKTPLSMSQMGGGAGEYKTPPQPVAVGSRIL